MAPELRLAHVVMGSKAQICEQVFESEMLHKIRIAILDDHPIVRSGLRMLLAAQPDMQVVGECAHLAELLQIVGHQGAEIALLDVGMPEGSGIGALKHLRTSFPGLKPIILTMHQDVALLRSALAAGASGFVLKQAADTDLLTAIRATQRGGLYIDSSLARALLSLDPGGTTEPKREVLSVRERQVVNLLARGYSNQEIAERLSMSVKTVETYRSRIADKLGLRTRVELTRYAVLAGLLRPEDFLGEVGTNTAA